ncbi:MAG: hypothetical protein RLY93_12430 [Sumerlaeia bacterium]
MAKARGYKSEKGQAILAEYKAGKLTADEIAEKHGVHRVTVFKYVRQSREGYKPAPIGRPKKFGEDVDPAALRVSLTPEAMASLEEEAEAETASRRAEDPKASRVKANDIAERVLLDYVAGRRRLIRRGKSASK